MCGIFDLLVFIVIWGSFGAFLSKGSLRVTRKRLAVERIELIFGTQAYQ